MTRRLCHHGVEALVAHVHPTHEASVRVARYLGLTPTDLVEDGEIRWTRLTSAARIVRSGRGVR
jgi:RimJ/RimL family protein N-acetyltransferase